MAGPIRKSRMKEVPLSEAKDDFSHLLREAAKQDIVIARRLRVARDDYEEHYGETGG